MPSTNQTVPTPTPTRNDEIQELELVSAALRNSTRLFQLITHIGDKYFQGETNKLREYDIATEVFGRSKDTFNGGEDAIVRVEASRLRKRLNEYYAGEGKDHPVHISIPPGTYIPVFTRRAASDPPRPQQETVVPEPVVTQSARRAWPYLFAIAACAATVLIGYLVLRGNSANKSSVRTATPSAQEAVAANATAPADVPLRILAGYSGRPQIDSAGDVWQPDEYFQAGGTWDRPDSAVPQTSNPMVFKHWRSGDFSYDIPLRPGVYDLHLYFIAVGSESGDQSTFTIYVNGDRALSGFDIRSDALGSNIADERVFRDVSPGKNGILHLGFASERAPAMLNAIEILPGTPHRQLPIRLITQPKSFTDHIGQFWHPDDYFLNGYTSPKGTQITGTSDPDLFAAERFGHFAYTIPVDSRDRYTLVLHFAEFYFGPNASGVGGEGSRVFRVMCNGTTLLDNFDIYKEAGSLHALDKVFYHLKPSAQGKL